MNDSIGKVYRVIKGEHKGFVGKCIKIVDNWVLLLAGYDVCWCDWNELEEVRG